ncbi:hypothetical protein TSAR_015773 [Trichomalopsis sarcophagae]|uniref:Thioredoxin domain-containing protein n=1 Tax=Trichomalopsis sarcophagae TaxID=543379 RepID=A0A232EQB8_9HYME|nr:hypothetical protein TSAR_015773 [Trichomalopsis sarcophagae]
MSSEENRELEESADTSSDAEELEPTEPDSKEQSGSNIKKEISLNNPKFTLEEKLSSKMFTYARETICFFLAVAFTALAALHSSHLIYRPPRISKPPIARPLFNESSLVLDFYKGHLGALVDRVTDADFSFVMYYAPWDAECQAIKEEFESVAQYYQSQVFFAAINCWHPGSECRTRYSKIQSYPVLMLYPSRESGVQYKGIRSAPYMIRFIHKFMNPIIRVNSDEELMKLLKSYDAVMIGYFNFSGLRKTLGYREYYRAALRTLEKDPNGEIAFVAITSRDLARDHEVTQFPSASLLMWNETLFFPDNSEWLAENLSNWINNVVHRVVTWLQPPGIKSLTFAPYLWDGPLLFLFTPRNPLHFENGNYNLLREIGLQYYDCSENLQIQEIVSRLRKSRLEAALKAFETREWCVNLLEEGKGQQLPLNGSSQKQRWSNGTANCCSDIPTNKCVICASTKLVDSLDSKVCAAPGAACRGSDIFGLPFAFEEGVSPVTAQPEFSYIKAATVEGEIDGTCQVNSCDSSTNDEEVDDPRSSTSVRKAFYREECRQFLAGYSYQRPIFPREPDNDSDEVELTEAICRVNKTLALVAIDSLHYFHFAESLGIDVGNAKDKTTVVILDPADESQFVMQDEYGRNTLVQFINNYTNGYLARTMRSNNPRRFARSFVPKSDCKRNSNSKICVPELSTDNFLDTVLNPRKDVVVMYHSPYCAFCSAVAYVYLTVANYLSKMDHLEFVRIDGDNNDLPWEYTMNRYPSILFFPAKRKEDSTLYPWQLPVSVGNLLSFVLANLDEESHVEALINVCAAGAGGSPPACLARIRWLCLDVLEDHLREFRRLRRSRLSTVDRARARMILLLRLEHVRQVHLLLGSTGDLSKDVAKVRLLRSKFKLFYAKLENLRHDKARVEEYTLTSRSS